MSDPVRGELILYESPEGKVRVEVHHEAETFWLSQRRMAEVFDVDVRTVNEHLGNIYSSAELSEQATIQNSRTIRREGDRSA